MIVIPKSFSSKLLSLCCFLILLSLFLNGCKKKSEAPPPPPPEVSTITIASQQLRLTTELPGRTSAYMIAEIRPQVNGIIKKRLFTEGAEVKAGDVLYEIDPAPFKAALESARASLSVTEESAARAKAALEASKANVEKQKSALNLAETNLKRIENLYNEKVVPESQRDQYANEAKAAEAALKASEAQVESDKKSVSAAGASIDQAEATVKTAKINLGYTTIKAPISGRIGKSNITEGALVIAYQTVPLATIQQFDPIYVDVIQSTSELFSLKQRLNDKTIRHDNENQNKVKLILEENTPYPMEGELQFRDVTVDPSTGSYTIRIVFPNPDGIILPGMFVRAVVEEGIDDKAILIPQQALTRNSKGEPQTMIVNAEGKAEQRMLTVDRAIGNNWLVSSGLAPGDRVIVEGIQKVRDGSAVKEVPFVEKSQEKQAGAPQSQPQAAAPAAKSPEAKSPEKSPEKTDGGK